MAFTDRYRDHYEVEPIRAILPIAPSTHYLHEAREADPDRLPPRAKRDVQLKAQIRRARQENFEVYGGRKAWRQLNRDAIYLARCTVERLVGELGLAGAVRGKRPNALWVYVSIRYTERLAEAGIEPSVGSVGDS